MKEQKKKNGNSTWDWTEVRFEFATDADDAAAVDGWMNFQFNHGQLRAHKDFLIYSVSIFPKRNFWVVNRL